MTDELVAAVVPEPETGTGAGSTGETMGESSKKRERPNSFFKLVEQLSEDAGMWCAAGVIYSPCPLVVRGKVVQYPISAAVCEELYAQGNVSSFGLLTDTKTDAEVRRSREYVAGEDYTLGFEAKSESGSRHGSRWVAHFNETLDKIATQFGMDGVVAKPHKLMLYGPGDHFAEHRDTLRHKDHVGTLLVSLPTMGGFQGGELTVCAPGSRHSGRWPGKDTWQMVFGAKELASKGFEMPFVAFFTDCPHTLAEVTGGWRAILSFELCGRNEASREFGRAHEDILRAIEQKVRDRLKQAPSVSFLTFHSYSESTVGTLRGVDALMVAYLKTRDDLVVDWDVADIKKEEATEACDIWSLTMSTSHYTLCLPDDAARLLTPFPPRRDEEYDADEAEAFGDSDGFDTKTWSQMHTNYELDPVFTSPGGYTGNEGAPAEYHYVHALVRVRLASAVGSSDEDEDEGEDGGDGEDEGESDNDIGSGSGSGSGSGNDKGKEE